MIHRIVFTMMSLLPLSTPALAASSGIDTDCGVIGKLSPARYSITICLVHTSGENTFCLRGGHYFAAAPSNQLESELDARVGKLACVSGRQAGNGDLNALSVSDDVRCRESPAPNECR
ncbi:MAG: hypothetical protein ACXWR1_08240 [Bdellovibrionota bacterium]